MMLLRIIQTATFAAILLLSTNSFCQTLTPLFITNDSIDIQNIKFISNRTGAALKTKIKGPLVHINDILPPDVKMIVPFKDGTLIILDNVETKYFQNNCVITAIHVPQQDISLKGCPRVTYSLGCRIIPGKSFCTPGSKSIQFIITPYSPSYTELTKNLDIDHEKRMKRFFKKMKRTFPGYQF